MHACNTESSHHATKTCAAILVLTSITKKPLLGFHFKVFLWCMLLYTSGIYAVELDCAIIDSRNTLIHLHVAGICRDSSTKALHDVLDLISQKKYYRSYYMHTLIRKCVGWTTLHALLHIMSWKQIIICSLWATNLRNQFVLSNTQEWRSSLSFWCQWFYAHKKWWMDHLHHLWGMWWRRFRGAETTMKP